MEQAISSSSFCCTLSSADDAAHARIDILTCFSVVWQRTCFCLNYQDRTQIMERDQKSEALLAIQWPLSRYCALKQFLLSYAHNEHPS